MVEVAETMTSLRCITIEDDEMDDGPCGGVRGLTMMLSASWPMLKKMLLRPFPLRRIPEGVSWRVAGIDEEDHTILEKLD